MNRPSLKESVGTSVNSINLASDTLREHPVDRVAALARADALGSALWRLKVGGDMTMLKRAVALLALRARAQDKPPLGEWTRHPSGHLLVLDICERIINEWLQDKCPKCKGRGRTGMGKGTVVNAMADCPMCSGAGRMPHIGRITLLLMGMGTRDGSEVAIETVPCGSCDGKGKVPLEKTVKEASLGKVCTQCQGSRRRRINGA